jgi:hypothetical protein
MLCVAVVVVIVVRLFSDTANKFMKCNHVLKIRVGFILVEAE